MSLRVLLVAILVLWSASALAAAKPAPAVHTPGGPPMIFYVVRGEPDSCGRGCDRWIMAEGRIDSDTSARFKEFFGTVKDRRIPIYFVSPGGRLDQAMAMGATLRERSATARVGRTTVWECGFEAQDSETCLKLKQSGHELHGKVFTRDAMCNSACPFLILGATTREVAPDAGLGIHSPQLVMSYNMPGTPSAALRAVATQRAQERGDLALKEYVAKMRVDPGLLALMKTVKFEEMHMLTRDEIARFGIDPRELAETPWTFESIGRNVVRKAIAQKNDGDKSYHFAQLRLICVNNEQFGFDFLRQQAAGAVLITVALAGGDDPAAKRYFAAMTSRAGQKLWALRVPKNWLRALADQPNFDLTDAVQMPDGSRVSRTTRLSTEGLATALDHLLLTCPPPNSVPTGVRQRVAN